jgi:hypothetical protein
MINTRAQQQTVEYLKLYQDLLSRFAVDDRKIGSTEQAAISFIDVNANSVLDTTEQASLNNFNSKLNQIVANSATYLDSSGKFANNIDLDGNGIKDSQDKTIFDRIITISENVYEKMERYLTGSLKAGKVYILDTPFNEYDMAQLLDATKNGRENYLYPITWSNDASRVAKMTTSAPPLSVAAFQELFNGNRGLGVTGLFDEGLGLDQANKVLDLIDSGITDVNSLKFYGRLLDSGVLISTPTIKAFDNLWKKAEFAGVNVSPLGQIKTASGINVTAFSGGSGPAGNTPGDHLNHLMNILLKAGDPDPNIASQQSRYLQGSLQAGEVAITGKPLTYTNLMEVNDAIPDSETFDKLKIQYWTKGLSAQQLGNRNRQDLNRVFNRLYEQSNYNTIQEFQRLLEENGLYDPSGLNYYRELMEEMERGKAFTLDLATFDNAIASSRELDTYIDLNTANTRPTAARQIDEVWTQPLPVPLINSSHSNYTNHRQAFIDLVNATGSIAKTQAYFVSDIYGSLTNKDDILAYKDAYITGGASAHTLSELQKFRIDEGLSWPQAQTLIDLLEDPAGTTHAPDGIVNPQRARRHELLKEALAFGELPDTVNLNYKPLNYAALMTLLNSV